MTALQGCVLVAIMLVGICIQMYCLWTNIIQLRSLSRREFRILLTLIVLLAAAWFGTLFTIVRR